MGWEGVSSIICESKVRPCSSAYCLTPGSRAGVPSLSFQKVHSYRPQTHPDWRISPLFGLCVLTAPLLHSRDIHEMTFQLKWQRVISWWCDVRTEELRAYGFCLFLKLRGAWSAGSITMPVNGHVVGGRLPGWVLFILLCRSECRAGGVAPVPQSLMFIWLLETDEFGAPV